MIVSYTRSDGSPHCISGCCGIGEFRNFAEVPSGLLHTNHTRIENIRPSYTNLNVATFSKEPTQVCALEEIRKYHDIIYESEWENNTGPGASEWGTGEKGGVKLIVFRVRVK